MHTKTTLSQSLQHWQTSAFRVTLKKEIAALKSAALPLQNAVTQGGYVNDNNVTCSILSSKETATSIEVKLAVFFSELVPSCSCGDDPLEINGYCELQLSINKKTANASFELLTNALDSDC